MTQGIRGNEFITFLTRVISLSGLKPGCIARIVENIKLFETAFTHPSANGTNNYEALEFVGDSVLNKAIVSYIQQRFPKLMVPKGVNIMSRLKINLVSGHAYATIAKRFSFGPFISLGTDKFIKDEILEDVFEAFFGAVEFIIDGLFYVGFGYTICFKIIAAILNSVHISLLYEDLFDAKTRLKETIDVFKSKIGCIRYNRVEKEDTHEETVYITRCFEGTTTIIGNGTHQSVSVASQIAAAEALKYLETVSIKRPVPDKFTNLVSLYS